MEKLEVRAPGKEVAHFKVPREWGLVLEKAGAAAQRLPPFQKPHGISGSAPGKFPGSKGAPPKATACHFLLP